MEFNGYYEIGDKVLVKVTKKDDWYAREYTWRTGIVEDINLITIEYYDEPEDEWKTTLANEYKIRLLKPHPLHYEGFGNGDGHTVYCNQLESIKEMKPKSLVSRTDKILRKIKYLDEKYAMKMKSKGVEHGYCW